MGHWGGRISKYEPTEAEIRQRCLAIQAEWGEQERLNRLRADWRPSYRRADGEREAITAGDYSSHHGGRERLQEVDR